MEAGKPVWRSGTFLLYAGGLTVLFAAGWALTYLGNTYGRAAFAGWAALVFLVLALVAASFRRAGNWIAGGVFAFATLIAWAVFAGAVESWWGWLPRHLRSVFAGFHVGLLLLELLILTAAVVVIALFRFPLLALVACAAAWFFVTDLVSSGGNWSAFITLFVGAGFLTGGLVLDHTRLRTYGFWLHVAGGLTGGGALLFFWHSGDARWSLLALAAVGFVALARVSGRSSWAVLGAAGLFLAATHFALEWTRVGFLFLNESSGRARPWVPAVVFAALGFLLVLLGLLLERRRRVPQPPPPLAAE